MGLPSGTAVNNLCAIQETSLEEAKASVVETTTAGVKVGHSFAAFRLGKISKYRHLSPKDEEVSQYVSSDT